MIVEICLAPGEVPLAVAAGADRVELCRRLDIGGLTPTDTEMTEALNAAGDLGIRVIVREQEDFRHTPSAMTRLVTETARLAAIDHPALSGIVTGALDAEGGVDPYFLAELRSAAGQRALVFHRAIDAAARRTEALEAIAQAGFDAVLTTGGPGGTADPEGLAYTNKILPAIASGSLRAHNIATVLAKSGCTQVHFRAPGPSGTDPQLAARLTALARAGC
ncbi:MAG: copper homeostasis protein CutC [Flaviflexus sp.]|nr:copper homeostasis protein CutC [Flaviflexus sp.]